MTSLISKCLLLSCYDNCYAFTLHDKRHRAYLEGRGVPSQYAKPFSEVQLFPDRLQLPLTWRKPRKIFVASMSDLFHSQVPEDYIRQIFEVMRKADWHIFQILTKCAGRLRHLGPHLDWPPNVWIGVSIETDLLTPRADALQEVPTAVRFLSCEPLLGPLPSLNLEGIHWVITGAESGKNARQMKVDWVRELRDKCISSNVPFFLKQFVVNGRKIGLPELDGKVWNQFPFVGECK